MKLNILYEDKDILVVYKPAFISSQEERGAGVDMISMIRNYYAKKGIGNVDVHVVHRLDKPVAGIMVYALNKRAAAGLSKAISQSGFNKEYYAVLTNIPENFNEEKPKDTYTLRNFLLRDGRNNISKIVADSSIKEAKEAVLDYEITMKAEVDSQKMYLAKIKLHTGRHHQIRVQFSGNNAPLYGDKKYNMNAGQQNEGIALCAYKLEFEHPVTKRKLSFQIKPDNSIFQKFDFK